MGPVLVGGSLALLGVVVGIWGGFVAERKRWRREERVAAGNLLADLYDLIWGDKDHGLLVVHLMKVRVRLTGLEVSADLINRLDSDSRACWRDGRTGYEHFKATGDEEWGVSGSLLKAFQTTTDDVLQELHKR